MDLAAHATRSRRRQDARPGSHDGTVIKAPTGLYGTMEVALDNAPREQRWLVETWMPRATPFDEDVDLPSVGDRCLVVVTMQGRLHVPSWDRG